MTGSKATAVQNLIQRLSESPVMPSAEWRDQADDCYAVVIPLADGREIRITDREDAFRMRDYASDAEVFGFYVEVLDVAADGTFSADEDGRGYIYCTNEEDGIAAHLADPGDKVIDLDAEVGYAVEAITGFVAAPRLADTRTEADYDRAATAAFEAGN